MATSWPSTTWTRPQSNEPVGRARDRSAARRPRLAAASVTNGGPVIAFAVKGGFEATSRFVGALELATHAVSLGGVESLIELSALPEVDAVMAAIVGGIAAGFAAEHWQARRAAQ